MVRCANQSYEVGLRPTGFAPHMSGNKETALVYDWKDGFLLFQPPQWQTIEKSALQFHDVYGENHCYTAGHHLSTVGKVPERSGGEKVDQPMQAEIDSIPNYIRDAGRYIFADSGKGKNISIKIRCKEGLFYLQ